MSGTTRVKTLVGAMSATMRRAMSASALVGAMMRAMDATRNESTPSKLRLAVDAHVVLASFVTLRLHLCVFLFVLSLF